MPLLNDHLSVWEIGFRWAGHDPDKLRFRIPLAVRDNFRVLIREIYESQLDCYTLNIEKYHGHDPEESKQYIQHWLPAIEECIGGRHFDRKLLKWANIDRNDFQTWCEHRKILLPEFWFPAGWELEYEWSDDSSGKEGGQQAIETTEERRIRLDRDRRAKMACQQIAQWLWSKKPGMTIKEVVLTHEIQDMCGGQHFEFATVRGWIAQVDPHNPSKKREPKHKNNPGSDNPVNS